MAFSRAFCNRGGLFVIVFRKNMVRTASPLSVGVNLQKRKFGTYEEAIYALNGLQTNAASLELHRKDKSLLFRHVPLVKKSLEKLGVTSDDLDALKIIHVAGTKGKGSTCAFTESILRQHGFKTGFYSSPHLVAVRERIQINGQPLSKEAFSLYFWDVYNTLKSKLGDGEQMPSYFSFLTVLAFCVFIKEKVDATVLEVGLGGQHDSTNVIRKPFVVGVTSLSLDHTRVLGDTVEKIAWEKAGIFKPGVPAFTVPQPDGAMQVLQQRAQENKCSLHIAPPLETYPRNVPCYLGVPGAVQSVNASLALQLARTWLLQHHQSETGKFHQTSSSPVFAETDCHFQLPPPLAHSFLLTSEFAQGLQKCVWPGRFQTIQRRFVSYYLDGAHNTESMEFCAKWFNDVSRKEAEHHHGSVFRVLLFSCTGDRKAENLLVPLSDLPFDLALFCPTKVTLLKDSSSDQSNFTVDPEKEMQQCERNMQLWCHLINSVQEVAASVSLAPSAQTELTANVVEGSKCNSDAAVFPSILSALNWLSNGRDSSIIASPESLQKHEFSRKLTNDVHVQLLVTGSLHLVGGVLSVIDPDLKSHSYDV